jgi:hypothetical protein
MREEGGEAMNAMSLKVVRWGARGCKTAQASQAERWGASPGAAAAASCCPGNQMYNETTILYELYNILQNIVTNIQHNVCTICTILSETLYNLNEMSFKMFKTV